MNIDKIKIAHIPIITLVVNINNCFPLSIIYFIYIFSYFFLAFFINFIDNPIIKTKANENKPIATSSNVGNIVYV